MIKFNYDIQEDEDFEYELERSEYLRETQISPDGQKTFCWADIIGDYKAGLSINKLAQKYNMRGRLVWYSLVGFNVKMRSHLRYMGNWKGGITPENARIRGSAKMLKWREDVLKRDKRRCKRCNTLKKPQAHHVRSFAEYPDKRFDIDNGVTLCKSCHKLFHKTYGNNPDNPEDKVAQFVCNKQTKTVD